MNAITWFEIPAIDFDRAVTFYETALGVTLARQDFGGDPNGIFPYSDGKGVGGSVVVASYARPSDQGPVIYLNAQSPHNLEQVLSRIETSGGKVIMPKTDIGRVGFIAMILDTEGNRIGLHAEHPKA